MDNFLNFYQHIPYSISPVAFSLGAFSVGWYSLMYLAGFIAIFLLMLHRIRRGEVELEKNILLNYFFYAFIGLSIGARLGYVFFYDFSRYLVNPLEIISPYDPATGTFVGIYGLSFHGGLLGIVLATFIFCRRYKLDFWNFANSIASAAPAGYFFGRIGNFLNGELYGRATQKFWGMYFPEDGFDMLRHPSQLYEAALEGLLLFVFLWTLRNKERYKPLIFPFFIVGYSIARITAEFFRQPDAHIGYIFGFLTLGQILSLFLFVLGGVLVLVGIKSRKMV